MITFKGLETDKLIFPPRISLVNPKPIAHSKHPLKLLIPVPCPAQPQPLWTAAIPMLYRRLGHSSQLPQKCSLTLRMPIHFLSVSEKDCYQIYLFFINVYWVSFMCITLAWVSSNAGILCLAEKWLRKKLRARSLFRPEILSLKIFHNLWNAMLLWYQQ